MTRSTSTQQAINATRQACTAEPSERPGGESCLEYYGVALMCEWCEACLDVVEITVTARGEVR